MFTASEKRKENIAEYLLYMWHIEDLIRAFNLDINAIIENIIKPQNLPAEKEKTLTEWYESLIEMMKDEDVVEKGHLQINKNVIINLTDFHNTLLNDDTKPQYRALFYSILPIIVEIRAKSGNNPDGEIESCFNLLYATLLMRLQKREVSKETQSAIKQVTNFLATLTKLFHEDENAE